MDTSRKGIRMLFLSRREVEALLDPELLVEALGPAMEELSRGSSVHASASRRDDS